MAKVYVIPAVHELKAWPEFFRAVQNGTKSFEVRRDDRGFEVGHMLWLREWSEATGYTGRAVARRITYILREHPGLAPGFVCLALHVKIAPDDWDAGDDDVPARHPRA